MSEWFGYVLRQANKEKKCFSLTITDKEREWNTKQRKLFQNIKLQTCLPYPRNKSGHVI
jgi:hypothetical protein